VLTGMMTGTQVDCGDIPISPYDNSLAYSQIEAAYTSLLSRPVSSHALENNLVVGSKGQALDGKEHPKIITLGGDHSVVLPVLRSLKAVYGEISVIVSD
jgi:agmatinase